MHLKYKSWLAAMIALFLVTTFHVSVLYAAPYEGYNYTYWKEPISSPIAYTPDKMINGTTLNLGPLKLPEDIFVANGKMYLLDTGNNRILILDDKLKVQTVFSSFRNGETEESFNKPEGIFVTEQGDMYICDTENQRIVQLDNKGKFIRFIESPKSEVIPDGFIFYPRKVVVDEAGRIFVIARGVFDGVIEYSADGEFTTFTGVNHVQFNAVDYFWKRLATKKQRAQMALFVPTEFVNFDIDKEGFIYTVSNDKGDKPIKRLNPTGQDVLTRNAHFPPIGDLAIDPANRTAGYSFSDIKSLDNGMYGILDRKKGKVFTYDEDGNLLYIFGQLGNQLGTFMDPVAMEMFGDKMVILDKLNGSLTVFQSTLFGQKVNEAVVNHYLGKEELSANAWSEVLSLDVNFNIAYIGMGKAFLRQDEYKKAMSYFKKGMDQKLYSVAFQKYRKMVIREHFGLFFSGIVAFGGLLFIASRMRRLMRKGGKRYEAL